MKSIFIVFDTEHLCCYDTNTYYFTQDNTENQIDNQVTRYVIMNRDIDKIHCAEKYVNKNIVMFT